MKKKKAKKLQISKETLAHLQGGSPGEEPSGCSESASRSYCMPECMSGFAICIQ
jgi:hypothetical protein